MTFKFGSTPNEIKVTSEGKFEFGLSDFPAYLKQSPESLQKSHEALRSQRDVLLELLDLERKKHAATSAVKDRLLEAYEEIVCISKEVKFGSGKKRKLERAFTTNFSDDASRDYLKEARDLAQQIIAKNSMNAQQLSYESAENVVVKDHKFTVSEDGDMDLELYLIRELLKADE